MKGVTKELDLLKDEREVFQPTHPWKVWQCISLMLWHVFNDFNPHTRERCDLISYPTRLKSDHFNPHTRERCDTQAPLILLAPFISTHTPVKGVTAITNDSKILWRISTHTPVKGVTVNGKMPSHLLSISTHTPVKGVTKYRKPRDK